MADSLGKTVFLISPIVPYPPARGIELRICRMLQWLHKQGYKVVLVLATESIDSQSLAELKKISSVVHWLRPALRTRVGARLPVLRRALWEPLKRMQLLWRHAENATANSRAAGLPNDTKGMFAPPRLISLVQRLAQKYRPTAVIVEYIYSVPVFAGLPPETLKIIDTIDVFSRKDEQVLSFGIADSLACDRSEERDYLLAGDAVIAIQSRELELLAELVPERDVFLAGIDCEVIASINDEEVVPHSIAIVASDNALNIHGLEGFLAECWPAIKYAVPSATLHVVGRVGTNIPACDPSVRYSGWVDDLDSVYREASVIANPTVAGTGLKIKSVQALAHGKPLVAWSNGVEGLDYQGTAPYLECRSWGEFTQAIISLLRSDDERLRLSKLALSYATKQFATEKVYSELKSRLESTGLANKHVQSAQRGRESQRIPAR